MIQKLTITPNVKPFKNDVKSVASNRYNVNNEINIDVGMIGLIYSFITDHKSFNEIFSFLLP